MVKLFDTDIRDQGRRSSKGNQLKFERCGMWYKADYLGYEGLAEYVISALLHFSDLDPCEYVDYEPEQIEYNGNVYPGCRSRDFTGGWNLITLERLFKDTYGYGLNKVIYSTPDHKARPKTFCDSFTEQLDIAEEMYGCPMSFTFEYKDVKEIHVFQSEKVIRIESNRHYTVICCRDDRNNRNEKKERIHINFSDVAELFGSKYIELRRGLLVNPDYIEKISGAEVVLTDGSTYILPKAKKDSVTAKYIEYITEKTTM